MALGEPSLMTATKASCRQGYAAKSALALRAGREDVLRERHPGARIMNELVIGAREVRADVVAIDTGHIAAMEVKGAYDNTTRPMHQVDMFQLCVPDVWMCVAKDHYEDGKLIRHLLPSVGLILSANLDGHYHRSETVKALELDIEAEPLPREAVTEMILEMLWAEQLRAACNELRISVRREWRRRNKYTKIKDLRTYPLMPPICVHPIFETHLDVVGRVQLPLITGVFAIRGRLVKLDQDGMERIWESIKTPSTDRMQRCRYRSSGRMCREYS